MENDLYFDCPECSHTLMVESTLVGQLVECPDCAKEVPVPDIRDGRNPRFKRTAPKPERQAGTLLAKREEAAADLLVEEMSSLQRRMKEQGRQLEYIRFNAELSVKQIQLLKQRSAVDPARAGAESREETSAVSLNPDRYLKWSMAFACVAFALGAGVLLVVAFQP